MFALFSAGVVFGDLGSTLIDPVSLGIVAGLVGGKLIGIAGGSWLATKLTPAELNPTLRWIDIVGMSQLAGIGFTVSLLISELSFPRTRSCSITQSPQSSSPQSWPPHWPRSS